MKDKLNEILGLMTDIKYGFIDNKNTIHTPDDNDYVKEFVTNYKLCCNNELMEKKVGICWDQVELVRYYLDKNEIKGESYVIVCYDNEMDPTHTFIVVNGKEKVYLVEQAWKEFYGVYEFDNINELFDNVIDKFKSKLNKKTDDKLDIRIYLYDKPEKNYDCMSFYEMFSKGIRVR